MTPEERKPQWFEVVSAPYWSGRSDYEPGEEGCDVTVVRCLSPRRAKVLAVRFWRHCNNPRIRSRSKQSIQRAGSVAWGDENPFRGMKVYRVPVEEWEPDWENWPPLGPRGKVRAAGVGRRLARTDRLGQAGQ